MYDFYPGQLQFISQRAYEPDPELDFYSKLIEDKEIDEKLAYLCDFREKRGYRPSTYIRIHILHQMKQISSFNKLVKELKLHRAYRKFCGIKSKSKVPCAASLSNFRSKIDNSECAIIGRIFLKNLEEKGKLGEMKVYLTDATDIESPTSFKVIDKEIDPETGKERKIFNDRDAAVGKRAKKKNKNQFFIGFKKHTISLLIPDENISLPLCSIVKPANVPECMVLEDLVKLAKSQKIPMNILTADLAYHDAGKTKELWVNYGVALITDKKSNTVLPDEVDDNCAPTCDMDRDLLWAGFDNESKSHCYVCPLSRPEECFHYPGCPLEKWISMDVHPIIFGPIPFHTSLSKKIRDARKYVESVFGRQKNNDNLSDITLKGTKNAQFLSIIADGVDTLKYFHRRYMEKKEESRKKYRKMGDVKKMRRNSKRKAA